MLKEIEERIGECKKIKNKARNNGVMALSKLAEDIMQDVIVNYYVPQLNSIDIDTLTLEDCFEIYHIKHIACECFADEEKIYFAEEKYV